MAYRKWQKKKISLSIEELTEQEEYVLGSGSISRTNLGRVRPSLSLYPSALWTKLPIEDGRVLYDWTDYVPATAIQSRHVDFSGDGLFYIKMKGGHVAIGIDNSPYNAWIYSIGLGFQYVDTGVVTDGVSISSLIVTNSSGTIRTTYTTIPTLPTEYHEFVGWIDRMRQKFCLFHLNSGNQLVALDISDSAEIEAESHLRVYVWNNADMPYARMCSPNLMSIGDSIGYYGMDSDPWSDYPKNFSLVLKDRGIKNWFVCNKHITSQKSAEITARLSTDIIPHNPQYCFLQSSNNDTSADPGIEDRITNINNGIAALKAADIKVILTNSIVPNPEHFQYPDSATFFKLANTYHTAETFPDADALIDINTPVADENGELKYPDYAIDGIHPNRTGRGLIGDSIDRQLAYPNSDTMNTGRQAYYEKTLYSELTDEEYKNEPVENGIGCVNWNPTDGVQNIEIINEDSGGIEIGSIKIDMAKPFWGDSYIDLNEMIFYDHGGFEEVTVSSGAATLSANGTGTCYLVDSSGNYYYGTVSGDAVTTDAPDGDYTVIYELETPLESNVIAASTFEVSSTSNSIQIKTYRKASFDTDGYTTVFNTSFIPITVLLNGLDVTSEVTLGASSVTFNTAPRRKQLLEVESVETLSTALLFETTMLDASGTVKTVPALVDLSVTENEEKTGYLNVNGAPLKVAGNKTYTVTLNKDLIESQDNILEEYRGKKFRLKVENSRDSSTEYLGVCHIDPEASLNYLNGTESINIKCGDLYD